MLIPKVIKDHFWTIIGAVAVLAIIILFRDMDRAEELKSFFRRKKVEEEVDKIKSTLSTEQAGVELNDEKLVKLAEELKEKKIKVADASDEEIKSFYKDFLERE